MKVTFQSHILRISLITNELAAKLQALVELIIGIDFHNVTHLVFTRVGGAGGEFRNIERGHVRTGQQDYFGMHNRRVYSAVLRQFAHAASSQQGYGQQAADSYQQFFIAGLLSNQCGSPTRCLRGLCRKIPMARIHISAVGNVEETVIIQISIPHSQRKLHTPAPALSKRETVAGSKSHIQQRDTRITVLIAVGIVLKGIVIRGHPDMYTGEESVHLSEPVTHFRLHAESAELAGRSKIIDRRVIKGKRTETAGEMSYSTAAFIIAIPHAAAFVFSSNEWLLRPVRESGLNIRLAWCGVFSPLPAFAYTPFGVMKSTHNRTNNILICINVL